MAAIKCNCVWPFYFPSKRCVCGEQVVTFSYCNGHPQSNTATGHSQRLCRGLQIMMRIIRGYFLFPNKRIANSILVSSVAIFFFFLSFWFAVFIPNCKTTRRKFNTLYTHTKCSYPSWLLAYPTACQ